ncbi:reticulon-4-like isoform X2 [Syngnathoides biaculeatus]|uniref:reticulon-4-like isoform X2 n=1 Tax=Syngnathoides biaculeatus TaxID=300417 RepID=UPI002ADDAEAE|nr:reticulon-4-like isoform X2 [Syngnathoides biaculeatus]
MSITRSGARIGESKSRALSFQLCAAWRSLGFDRPPRVPHSSQLCRRPGEHSTGGSFRCALTALLISKVDLNSASVAETRVSLTRVGQRKMADNEERQVSSSSAFFSDDVHHYQPEQDLYSLDDIVDLVGGAQDALERHMAEDGEPRPFAEPREERQPAPVPQVREMEEEGEGEGEGDEEQEEERREEREQLIPDSTASVPRAPSPPAESDALLLPQPAAQPPVDTHPAPAPASYVPSSPSKAQPQPLMQFPTELEQKGHPPAPISPLSPLHSPDSLEELSLTESPNQPFPIGAGVLQGSFSTQAPAVHSKENPWEDDEDKSGPGYSQNKGELDQLTGPYLSLGKDPGPHILCEDSGVSFSPEEKQISSEPSPVTSQMVPESHIASSNPTDHWDSPCLASQDNTKISMDSFSKDVAAVGSPGYEPELHSNPSDEDDDLMYEVKKNTNPFDGFSPLADSGSYNFGEIKFDHRATKVSESPTPDLVQYRQSEDLQDSPTSFLDERKTFEKDTKAIDSLMQPVSQFSSGLAEEDEDEEEEEEDSALPPSLPDILKSSPLNPDKLDSGSSDGSPEEQSPILERRMMESPNPPINLSANNPFALDAKVSLLQEMADEIEVRVSDKPKDEVKSFGAFDLVKEAEETTPPQVKVEEPVKIEQKDWFSSHVSPKMTEKFEPLDFESKKATTEDSDSESPTADSLSPVLEAMAKNPASFQVEKSNTKVELEEPEVAEEVSEQEVSSEEFEFIERPPKGVIDEFLEALDTSKFAPSKASELPLDEDVTFEEKGAASFSASAPVSAEMAGEVPSQSSYRLLTQKSKAELEKLSVQEAPSHIPPVHSAVRKPEEAAAQKSAEGSKLLKMPSLNISAVADLVYWRDVKTTGVVFGAALLLLLSLTVCSIVSVCSYVGLALLSVTVCFRIYKGILQAIQKSDEGHPFKQYLEREVALSEDMVHKYGDVLLEKINKTVSELRRLFLVEDLVDSIKFAVLMWVLTYVGAIFNGLTLVILAVIAAFSCPIIYEKHQAQIDHYLALINNQIKDVIGKIQAKVPGMKRKPE